MNRYLKLIFIMLSAVLLILSCNDDSADTVDDKGNTDTIVRIAVPVGSPAVTVARFLENGSIDKNINADVKLLDGPTEIPLLMTKKQADFIFVPLNLGAKLYNKGLEYKFLNVSVWGSFYIVSTNPDIKTWEDIKGRELYLFGEGSSPDILTKTILEAKGLDIEKDIKLVYQAANQNAQMVIADKIELALLPEPVCTLATMKNPNVKRVFEYSKEWSDIYGNDIKLAQAGFMVSNDFASKHPDIVDKFSKAYENEISALFKNTKEFAEYSEKHKIVANKVLVNKSLNRMGIEYKDAVNVKKDIEQYLKVLHDFNPVTIGGNIPDKDFYY